MTASRYSLRSSRTSAVRRSIASGRRKRRSNAQASEVAVVSWPASRSVISWSRISRSSIADPSSKRASTSIERMSSRAARSGSARRRAISWARISSVCRILAAVPRQGQIRRSRLDESPSAAGDWVVARISTRSRPSCRRRPSSSTPKTARMITSSVIACIPGWRAKRSPGRQRETSRSVASAITDSYARIRSPWKGGSISFRRRRCSSPPGSSSTDFGPSSGRRMMLRPGAIVLTRSAANSFFNDGGSEMTTTSPGPWILIVNASP